jgi:hypothetical protein
LDASGGAGLTPLTNQLWATWSPAVNWVDVHLADVSGDGKANLVGRDLATGAWWVGVPSGNGFVTQKWGQWSPAVTWVDVQVADVTGDGRADIIGRVLQTGEWWVAVSTGSSFVNQKWTTWSPAVTWVDVHAADVTGDGRADVVGRVAQSGEWWVGVSTGTSFVNQKWATWSPRADWVNVTLADVTGTGTADLVGRELDTGAWWVGISTGSSFQTTRWTTWSPLVSWVDVKVVDLTGNGRADLVGRVQQNGQWWVGLSSGSGFSNELWSTWSPGIAWVDVQAADVDGDGRMDLVGRDQASGDWWTARSTGSSFVNEKWGTWAPGVSWADVQAGDVTGSGKADLVGRLAAAGQWWTGLADPASLPLSFEPNQGQTDPEVQYLTHAKGYLAFLSSNQVVLSAPGQSPGASKTGSAALVQRMQLVGASPTAPAVHGDPLPGIVNYFLGANPSQWITNIPTYEGVTFPGIYPGVSVRYQGSGLLEPVFLVNPGASSSTIVMAFPDSTAVQLDASGGLVLSTPAGPIHEPAPVLYQETPLGTHAVPGQFVLLGNNQVGFMVGTYDHRRTLVIDPALVYATYLGGSQSDQGTSIAGDAAGDAYVTGTAGSPNFPVTSGSLQSSLTGSADAFVTKLDPTGTKLVYSTYLGGTMAGGGAMSAGIHIAVDDQGVAYVTGRTSAADFPTTSGAYQTTYPGGSSSAYVTALNAAGNGLVFSTFLGGANSTGGSGSGIAVQNGSVYVAGDADSTSFPTTAGVVQPTATAPNNGFVAQFTTKGALVFSTNIAGNSSGTIINGLAVDPAGNLYVTGDTTNAAGDFPFSSGAFRTTIASGGANAFVLALNPKGTAYVYGTVLGVGTGLAIAADAKGNAFVSGFTTTASYPTTPGSFEPTFQNRSTTMPEQAFVTKLNPTGTALVYSTFLGGSGGAAGGDIAAAITVDSSDFAYAFGGSASPDFPLVNPIQASLKGGNNLFLSVFNPAGSALVFSTWLGGSLFEAGTGVALDGQNNVLMTGIGGSTDFPVTSGAVQPTLGGMFNGLVAKISAINPPVSPPPVSPPPPASPPPGFPVVSPPPPPAPPAPPVLPVLNTPPDDRFEPNDTSDTATNFGALHGAQSFSGLSINFHIVSGFKIYDQDFYRWTMGASGTFAATLSNIAVTGGILQERILALEPNGSLQPLATSSFSSATTQTISAPVSAGQTIFLWVYGIGFAAGSSSLGTYDFSVSLN